MSKIDIFLFDKLNNTKEEINMIKPKTYKELLFQLGKGLKNLPKYYEIYIIGKNNEETKIYNEEKYKDVEDFLFIREIDAKILEESLYSNNYKKLSESQQDKLDEKFNCMLCTMVIKNENPYLCYQCQKIFHIKCLDNWYKKCKEENKKFFCPNCRNELPKENWNKKIDFEGNRKENPNLMNKINEYRLNNNMNNNINIIKDKKIDKLKHKEISQQELIKKYETYITKTINLFKIILNKMNSIHKIINSQINNELKNLIDFYPLNLENLYVEDISNLINEELELFENNFKNININGLKEENDYKKNLEKYQNILENNKIILGNNLSQIINNYNKDQISVMKIVIDFYKENYLFQMNFNNEIQINNLINNLFSSNIEFRNKTHLFNYITHDKRRKRIKFIFNSGSGYLIDIPIFFTNKELYSINERRKKFHSTNIILIHKNKILKNDESSLDGIANGDIIYVIENYLYPDKSYYHKLQNKYYGTDYINIRLGFNGLYETFSFSKEVTIQELTKAIAESKGYFLEDCTFSYNARYLNSNDKRKIKEIIPGDIAMIDCYIKGSSLGFIPFGKTIFAKGVNENALIGTLDPIRNLFMLIAKEKGKIIIGNVELTIESENYLSFYGINENFNFIWKEE